jgi:protocatechuate 4,5-dioxygenase alpha chain
MSLEKFRPQLRSNDLIQDLKWNVDLRSRFEADEDAVLRDYPLTDEERAAIKDRDFKALYELGLHPYLLSQLARLIFGTGEKAGSSTPATALLRSLLGDDFDRYMAERAR